MGRDTKYLTLAIIILCTIAALVVLTNGKRSLLNTEPKHTRTNIETGTEEEDSYTKRDASTTEKTNELYADNSNNGATPDAVADAYRVLSGDKTIANVPTTTTVENVKPKPTIERPSDYEALTNPIKRAAADKLTAKGGKAKSAATIKEEKLNASKLSGFLVVTNQFGTKENAMKEATMLKGKGYDNANVISLDNKVFMAYAGKMETREEAAKLLGQLKKKGFKPMVKDLN